MKEISSAIPFAAHIRPQDFLDICLNFFVGGLLVLLWLLPTGAIYLCTGSMDVAMEGLVLIGVFILLFPVYWASASAEGLRFHRVWGSPRLLKWSEITSIEPAPRREVILRGWLRFPPREASWSMSTLGHYRISWKSGFCYYPPANPALFEQITAQALKGDPAFAETLATHGQSNPGFEWRRLRLSVIFHGALDAFFFLLVGAMLAWRLFPYPEGASHAAKWSLAFWHAVGDVCARLFLIAPALGLAMGRLHRPHRAEGVVAAMAAIICFQAMHVGYGILRMGFSDFAKYDRLFGLSRDTTLLMLIFAAFFGWLAGRRSAE